MTATEVVQRIEDMFESQLETSDMYTALSKLQNELLGDPSGRKLKKLRTQRTADFWKRDKRAEAPEQARYWQKKADEL